MWFLPHLNAFLNSCATVLLIAGLLAIKKGETEKHKKIMLGAFCVSVLFLISYLIYHGSIGDVKFKGQGFIRNIYFPLLISHIILAIVIVPLILRLLFLAWKERFEAHKKLAKITLPLWLYVSLTGVLVYLFVYWLYP